MAKQTFKTYGDRLKDPRWQRKRLEILSRDEWACQQCYEKEGQLHVHHLIYSNGDPWDIEDKYLTTLCEDCHEYEHRQLPHAEAALKSALRGHGFLSDDIVNIGLGFYCMQSFHTHEVMSNVIEFALRSPEIMQDLTDKYFKDLAERKERREKEPNLPNPSELGEEPF
jgi:hypothetical protein